MEITRLIASATSYQDLPRPAPTPGTHGPLLYHLLVCDFLEPGKKVSF